MVPLSSNDLVCPLCSGAQQRTLSEGGGTYLRKCMECGSIYITPQPALHKVVAHFEGDRGYDEQELKQKFEVNRKEVLCRVAEWILSERKGGKILDVGCATGLFLECFFMGRDWQACGVDLSPAAVQIARKKGIKVWQGDLHSAQFPETTFDVITMLDAFYYLPKPLTALSELSRILKQDGSLLLELPMATTRLWRMSSRLGKALTRSRGSVLQNSDHLFYFTPRAISHLLTSCGFQVDKIIPLPANRQPTVLKNLAAQVYSGCSCLLTYMFQSTICFTPRYLVVANKKPHQTATT
jgi:ubiquinone/menaquinone biosynthesis C-methylase UbiE